MRFRVNLSGGVFNDEDGLPVDIHVDSTDLLAALVAAVDQLHTRMDAIQLVFSEEGHRCASLEMEVVKCKSS